MVGYVVARKTCYEESNIPSYWRPLLNLTVHVRVLQFSQVPADCRVLKLASSTLSMDEGSLTGESVTTAKSTGAVCADAPIQGKANMVFSGSMVTAGTAIGVVVATGMSTEMGVISKGVATARLDEEKTPLGQKLDEFGNQVRA